MPQGGKVDVSSNQFLLKIAPNHIVHQYAIAVDPDDFYENDKNISIIMAKSTVLQRTIGSFAVSGKSIYTLNEIDESISFKTHFRGMNYTINIDKETGTEFNLASDFKNEDNTQS